MFISCVLASGTSETIVIVIYVVVQFYPWFKFYFPLFLGMVMYDNDFKTKGDKFRPRIKLNYHIYTQAIVSL